MSKLNQSISYILIAGIVFILGILLFMKIGNVKGFMLVSESMEPTLKEGSLLFQRKEAFNSIEIGEIITYKVKNSDIYITHRVKEIDDINQRILCKGDANRDVDNTFIGYDQYEGTLLFYLPYVGSILYTMQNGFGKVIGYFLIAVLVISIGYDIYQRKKKASTS